MWSRPDRKYPVARRNNELMTNTSASSDKSVAIIVGTKQF